jgi:hypothetical protein
MLATPSFANFNSITGIVESHVHDLSKKVWENLIQTERCLLPTSIETTQLPANSCNNFRHAAGKTMTIASAGITVELIEMKIH